MTCIADRRNELIREIAGAAHALHRKQLVDAQATLSELMAGAIRLLPRASHAGITLISRDAVRTAASTGAYPRLLDQIQAQLQEGPCLSSARQRRTVRVDDVAVDDRWPAYRQFAIRQTPVRSILSLNLSAESPYRGSLNVFAEQPDAFDDDTEQLGAIYALYAGMAWAYARRHEQFQAALASRDVIGQAKGMIMQRFSIDADQAFDLLKRLSQSSNTPVVDVAVQLVNSQRDVATHGPRRSTPSSQPWTTTRSKKRSRSDDDPS